MTRFMGNETAHVDESSHSFDGTIPLEECYVYILS